MCKLESFMYLYTLQVGVAIYSAWGLGLMTISVIVNISSILTSVSYADYLDDSTLTETCVHYAVFAIFISLGYVAYGAGMAGAYQERLKPMFTATIALCVHGFMWLGLTALSSCSHPLITGFFCLDHLRCADRFFISDANWRVSPSEPDHFWNFFNNYDPSTIYRTSVGCWEYCNWVNTPSSTPTAGPLPDETTTEPSSRGGSKKPIRRRYNRTTTAEKTKPEEEYARTIKRRTPKPKKIEGAWAAPQPPPPTTSTAIPPTALPTTTIPPTALPTTTIPPTALPTTTTPPTTVPPTTTTAIPPTAPEETTTPAPEETTTPVSTTTPIPCVCYKTEVQTLVGPLGAPIHMWITIAYSVLIIGVWYVYSICIFISFINFLREEEEEEEEEEELEI